jgi:hypothetical protein
VTVTSTCKARVVDGRRRHPFDSDHTPIVLEVLRWLAEVAIGWIALTLMTTLIAGAILTVGVLFDLI